MLWGQFASSTADGALVFMWTAQERLRFHLIIGMAAVGAALYAGSVWHVRWHELIMPVGCTAVLLAGAAYFRHMHRHPALTVTLVAIGQMTLFAVLAALLNYLLLSDRPLIDPLLARCDEALGLPWPGLFAALKGGAFGRVLTAAYESNGMQLAGVILLLGLTGRAAELDQFLTAFFIATLSALAFWAVLPSLGAAPYYLSIGVVGDLPGATVGRGVAQAWLDLKAGTLREMYLEELKGLVAFPSIHTVSALLIVHAVRGFRLVFWPALAWNVLMLISIPVDGGHHVVDMIGGGALAVISIIAASRVLSMIEYCARIVPAVATHARRALQTR